MNDHDEFDHGTYSMAPPEAGESMESRVRRLEAALAAIQDTRLMEDRVIEKVVSRIDQAPAATPASSPPPPADALHAAASQLDSMTSPTAPENGSLFSAKTWLLTDIIQEVRTFFAMFLDFRYKATMPSKLIPLVALVIFIMSWTVVRSIPIMGMVFDYAIDLFLVILVYKTLQREAARYRAIEPTLPLRAVVK
jgi:hypothetical protein